jgi:mannose/fructose/N-acetylgalactosamine-specific phosphotransferase system component IIC
VIVTAAYVAVWIAAALAALAGAWIGDSRSTSDDWDALGGAILGYLVGLVLGHVVWSIAAARVLRAFDRRRRAIVAVAVPPALVGAFLVVVFTRSVPTLGWSVLALPVAVPAALSWWATEPAGSLEADQLF